MIDETMLTQLPTAEVDINIHVKATINVTPFVARQKVNVLLLDKVGTGLLAETPTLAVTNGRLYWRVPVVVSLPGRGRLGQVGAVEVDVQTAEVLADEALLQNIADRATQLAQSSTS